MKNIINPTSGKILLHANGLGEVTAQEIEKRAGEIATIEGRAAANNEDRIRARAELSGTTLPPAGADEETSNQSLSRDPSDPPAQRGQQIPNHEGLDEEKATERLVSEGVEEAQHDQMFAARRKRAG